MLIKWTALRLERLYWTADQSGLTHVFHKDSGQEALGSLEPTLHYLSLHSAVTKKSLPTMAKSQGCSLPLSLGLGWWREGKPSRMTGQS
jgi:hypothetical protein